MLLKCVTNEGRRSKLGEASAKGASATADSHSNNSSTASNSNLNATNSIIINNNNNGVNNNSSTSSSSSTNSGTSLSTVVARGTGMRMTMATASTMTPRVHRKGFRIPSKRHPGKALPGKLHSISRVGPGKIPPGKRMQQRPQPPPCDNSNDSGFGFDQHVEVQNNNQHLIRSMPASRYISNGARSAPRVAHKRQPAASLNNVATSSNGRVQLEILSQPEQQHRARYQTEGSRGAVKDRSGNGFPIVRMVGYNKPTVLQVFIGTDIGRVAPHMFYQACKVAGKNSTQCNEKKVDGTMIIEIDFKPESDMTITCDCVGILKERNVDVEHRFPDHLAQKSKKKSTRCRMVFRTQLTHDDGTVETLQVCSNPIICTQPPGVPEICKKSLNSCPVDGGLELFIIGKNFLKDTHVVFQETLDDIRTNEMVTIGSMWEESVLPDKEYLQQTHLICTVPPYIHQNIMKPVTVQLSIISSGKKSESHTFTYTPKGSYTTLSAATTLSTLHGSMSGQDTRYMDTNIGQTCSSNATAAAVVQQMWPETKHEIDADMMPPPASTQMPMIVRRPSLTSAMITDQMVLGGLKTEILDESSQNSIADAMQSESLDRFPVVQGGDNGGLLVDQSPMLMHSQRIRKQSIEMLDMQSMSLLNESNSLPSFPSHHSDMNAMAAAAAAEIAVKNEQIAKEILSAAVVHQGQQTVDKFLSSLSPTIADMKPTPQMEPNSMFVNNAGTGAGVIFPQQTASNLVMASNAVNSIDQTLNNMLAAANHSPSNDMQSLSLVRSSSVSSTSSSSSSSSSSSPNSSPMTHDIILNSEPAAVITSVNMQQMLNAAPDANAAPSADHIPAEMILNSNISPSTILCPPNSVPNMMVNQVSLLNGIGMQPQASQDSLLNSIIMTPPSNSPPIQQQTSPQPQQQQQQQQQSPPRQVAAVVDAQSNPQVTATSTAVSNLIIKAAADFISNHENNPGSAIDALMSLNDAPIQTQSQVSQMLAGGGVAPVTTNTILPNAQSGMCSSVAAQQFLANTRHHQMMEAQARQQETVPLVNMLLNDVQSVTNVTDAAQSQYLQSLQKSNQLAMSVSPQTNQESLIQAVALAENALQENNVAVAQKQMSGMLPNVSLNVPQTTVPIPPTTAIPQELTTMSDQDLISYIDPSSFDQI